MKKLILSVALATMTTIVSADSIKELNTSFSKLVTNQEVISWFGENSNKLLSLTKKQKKDNAGVIGNIVGIYGYALFYEGNTKDSLEVFLDEDCTTNNCSAGAGEAYYVLKDYDNSYKHLVKSFDSGFISYSQVIKFYTMIMDGSLVIKDEGKYLDSLKRYNMSVLALNKCINNLSVDEAKECKRILSLNEKTLEH